MVVTPEGAKFLGVNFPCGNPLLFPELAIHSKLYLFSVYYLDFIGYGSATEEIKDPLIQSMMSHGLVLPTRMCFYDLRQELAGRWNPMMDDKSDWFYYRINLTTFALNKINQHFGRV